MCPQLALPAHWSASVKLLVVNATGTDLSLSVPSATLDPAAGEVTLMVAVGLLLEPPQAASSAATAMQPSDRGMRPPRFRQSRIRAARIRSKVPPPPPDETAMPGANSTPTAYRVRRKI